MNKGNRCLVYVLVITSFGIPSQHHTFCRVLSLHFLIFSNKRWSHSK